MEEPLVAYAAELSFGFGGDGRVDMMMFRYGGYGVEDPSATGCGWTGGHWICNLCYVC